MAQHLAMDLLPGTRTEAELIFYPSNYPIRAALKKRAATSSITAMPGYSATDELLLTYAGVLALNPWVEAIAAPLHTVVPVRRNDQWFVRDNDDRLVSLRSESTDGWKLMALSGGHPITVFGEWNGRSLLPISAWADGRYVEL